MQKRNARLHVMSRCSILCDAGPLRRVRGRPISEPVASFRRVRPLSLVGEDGLGGSVADS